MFTFPAPAKLNLFLHVVGRRPDGYHLLQTVFRFIDFSDQISFKLRDDGVIKLHNPIAGVPENKDLCARAAKLLQQKTATAQGIDIFLQKQIPMGGGLGGGSSDAATTLLALNQLWQVNLDREQLLELGLQLGADVPVFIFGQNAFAEGIGEKL
ncbi:MAG: 4-(cytidine 5'-diphospho)-2-C-methyl-D-erythritol kinase, partial [Betaproteobacteria bacterium]|nr:4-(cytidine 5'-diphospho)-2-C-methyl-D-erythritol kinase [Betaproteobacteria bacterium]